MRVCAQHSNPVLRCRAIASTLPPPLRGRRSCAARVVLKGGSGTAARTSLGHRRVNIARAPQLGRRSGAARGPKGRRWGAAGELLRRRSAADRASVELRLSAIRVPAELNCGTARAPLGRRTPGNSTAFSGRRIAQRGALILCGSPRNPTLLCERLAGLCCKQAPLPWAMACGRIVLRWKLNPRPAFVRLSADLP